MRDALPYAILWKSSQRNTDNGYQVNSCKITPCEVEGVAYKLVFILYVSFFKTAS